MPVTMKDIAQDLNLSIVTISKVLRNHPDIAETTRARVMKRIEELDYRPNVVARSLVTGKSYLIGLIVPDLRHPFFAEIADALSAPVSKLGYSTIISSSEERPEMEEQEIRLLQARRLDALVIASTIRSPEAFRGLERGDIPFVLIDRKIPGLDAHFVGNDDRAIGRVATEHLVRQGCKRIAHIEGWQYSTGVERFEGYREILKSNGLRYSSSLVIKPDFVDRDSVEAGMAAAKALFARRERPDGLFAFNDALAIGFMKVALNQGIRIPKDLKIVGCGNYHYAEHLRVPLTSVDQTAGMIGEKTAELLMKCLNSKKPLATQSVILNPKLIVRESSAERS